jgi:hypothetical protein
VNMHIKRFPDLPVDRQRALLKTEDPNEVCVYPTSSEITKNIDITQWNDRPFSKALALAEPQLTCRAFDMGALERYTSDPRYTVHFADYMGSMSVTNEPFSDPGFPDRDKVSLQTFGLGFGDRRIPHVVVYLRYLANLSPEHQQYWNSYLVSGDVRMCKQYYQSTVLGEFWKNRSIRNAIVEEMKLINAMSEAIWRGRLFRDLPSGDVPIGLTSFLRPTADNFHRFGMALDKLLSEGIDTKFFNGKVPMKKEELRPDGRIEVQRKGSLTLLAEWLGASIIWGDANQFREVVIAPLRDVRRLRQQPAHTFVADRFSTDYYESRRKLLWAVFNSLSNIRAAFAKHPNASSIKAPSWLDDEARSTLSSPGLDALLLYRAEYDVKLAVLRPHLVHDWCSHSADAFRYLAMTLDRRGATGFHRAIAYPAGGVV